MKIQAAEVKNIDIRKKTIDLLFPTSFARGKTNKKISIVKNKYKES